jgi:predicted ATPase
MEAIEESMFENVDFRDVGLYGRSTEIQILRDSFMRVAYQGKSEVIQVIGQAGVGKTKLVNTFLRDYVTHGTEGGICISGNFDPLRHEPISGFMQAISDLVKHTATVTASSDIEEMMQTTFSEIEKKELICILPDISLLMDTKISETLERSDVLLKCSARSTQLFQSFFKVILTAIKPVVLFLDDVQFMDEDSCQFLNALLADSQLEHLLLICAMEQLPNDHSLFQPSNLAIPLSSINIGCMLKDDIIVLVSDLFHLQDAVSFSTCLVEQTSLNILHIILFFEILYREGFLKFGRAQGEQWTCNITQIKQDIPPFDNLKEFLNWKIQRENIEDNAVYYVASCLGDQFSLDLLVHSFRLLFDKAWNDSLLDARSALNTAIDLGYLIKSSNNKYSFSHECMRQCWYNHMENDVCQTHLDIAMIIRSHMIIEQDSSLLFKAAGNIIIGKDCMKQMNLLKKTLELLLEACKQAIEKGAYVHARSLSITALELLKKDADHWENQQRLSVRIFTSTIALEICHENFENGVQLAREYLFFSSDSLDDFIHSNLFIFECLALAQRSLEATSHSFTILMTLGLQPWTTCIHLRFISLKSHVFWALRRKSDEGLLNALPLQCGRHLGMMKILGSLSLHQFFTMHEKFDKIHFSIIILTMVDLTLEHGVCNESCLAFAFFGLLLAIWGKMKDSLRFGHLVLQLLRKLDANHMKSKVVYIIQAHILHYTQSREECNKALTKSIPESLAMGEVESAFYQAYALILGVTISDWPLSSVEKEISRLCVMMQNYGYSGIFNRCACYWQQTLNYMGQSVRGEFLTGSVMVEADVISKLKNESRHIALQELYVSKLGLALFYESWDIASELVFIVSKGAALSLGHMSQYLVYFTLAVACTSIYRIRPKHCFLRMANRAIKKIRKWKSSGVKICNPMLLFLDAEWAIIKGSMQVPDLYLSASNGFSHCKCLPNFQALAHRRIGNYFASRGEHNSAEYYNSIALRIYLEWEVGDVIQQKCNFTG